MLDHPDETFDVAPFVDGHCKMPIAEIQAAVDGAISPKEAAKPKKHFAFKKRYHRIESHRGHRKAIVI